MQLQNAERKKVKLRLNLASASGYGKSYSSLLIAFGMCQNWQKIAVIDTENDSASLYAHLGNFKTLRLDPPYTPDRYIEAINLCEKSGIEIIIIDSITHVWKGSGGILEYQNSLGGKYQDWAKATPLYQRWLNAILQSPCHIITTNRKKQGYNMITENNRTKVEKVGLEDEIREGFCYEMTIALEIINDKHLARASKDRTGLFPSDKPEFIISIDTGKKIMDWCNSGKPTTALINDDESTKLLSTLESCKTASEVVDLYNSNPKHQKSLFQQFTAKKNSLENNNIIQSQNFSSNGNSNYRNNFNTGK